MKFLFLILFVFTSCVLYAQSLLSIEHYTTDNGLSQNTVQSIIQDDNGYIWVANWNGIERFDGYTFRNYKTYPMDTLKLSNVRMEKIVKTSLNNIWCLTYDRTLYLFNTRKERFEDIFGHNPLGQVKKVYVLPNGISWIECNNGNLYRVDENKYNEPGGIKYFGTLEGPLGNVLYKIVSDSDRDEWILTDNGITIYGHKKVVCNMPFSHFMELPNKQVLLSTDNGYFALYTKENGLMSLDTEFKMDSIARFHLLQDKRHVMIAAANTIGIYDNQNREFSHFNIPGSRRISIHNIKETNNGEVWMFDRSERIIKCRPLTAEVHIMDYPHRAFDRKYEEKRNACFIHEDEYGCLWMMMKNSELCYYDTISETLKQAFIYNNGIREPYLLNACICMIDDHSNIWVTIPDNGLKRLSFSAKKYEYITSTDDETRTVYIDKDSCLWVASKNGVLMLFDKYYQYQGNVLSSGKVVKDRQANFGCNIYCMCEDKSGNNIWMGSRTHGLFKMSKVTSGFKVSQYIHDEKNIKSLSSNSIFSVIEDSRGRIWVGCYDGGINILHQKGNGEIEFYNSSYRLNNYPDRQCTKVRCVYETSNGVIVIGTTGGLLTCSVDFENPENIRFYRNICHSSHSHALSNNDIFNVNETSDGRLFVAALSSGMNIASIDSLLSSDIYFDYLNKQNGLKSDLVLSSLEDEHGNLWIISSNCVSLLNLSTNIITHQSKIRITDALPLLDKKGNIIIGTTTGALCIYSSQIPKSRFVPPIVITEVDVHHGDHLNEKEIQDGGLILNPQERYVTISFAALDYSDSKSISYAYRLKGMSDRWIMANNTHTANFIKLKAGKYSFEVKSTNGDGVWVENAISLPIVVIPTFWETGWAICLYVLALLGIIMLCVYIVVLIGNLRHRVDIEQRLTSLKLKFFTDISHELRTPVTLIAGPIEEVLKNEKLSVVGQENMEVAKRNTERMLQLVNQILDFRKVQGNKMKLRVEQVDIIKIIHFVYDSFTSIAHNNDISFNLECQNASLLVYTDADKFEKILFNLLSNAFKYTPKGRSIGLKVENNEELIQIQVKDEGKGISSDAMGKLFNRFETDNADPSISTGIGLSLVKEFVTLMHGNVRVKSTKGEGSIFIVTLPCRYSDYQNDKNVDFVVSDGNDVQEYRDNEINNDLTLSILVIEDNDELRKFICGVLGREYRMLEACNGKEGLEITQKEMPDIVISDIMMPEMDGIAYLKAVRQNREVSHTPIVLLSAKTSVDDKIQGLEFGADEYMTKPFSPAYLKARITSLLKRRKELQEYYSSIKNVTLSSDIASSVNRLDEDFINNVIEQIDANIQNPDFNIDILADVMNMSRTVFYRKIKAIVGVSPIDFIKKLRMKKVIKMLDAGKYSISEVAYMCGFTTPQYFSKVFKDVMNCTPKEYKQKRERIESPD